MADLAPAPAFGPLLRPVGPPVAAGVTVAERSGLGLATVLARPGREAVLGERSRAVLGIDPPDGPRVAAAGPSSLVGTGPGAWLAVREGAGHALAAGLTRDLEGLASVCDQSGGYGVLRVSGSRARDALAKGIGLDLHPKAFPPGSAAATAAAHMGVILWRAPDDGEPAAFDVALFRSFAGSFWDWLSASAAEYGLRVETAIRPTPAESLRA